MLARSPYKTAEELGLRDWHYDGLQKVLKMLKGDELKYAQYPISRNNPVLNGFNMSILWHRDPECGTIGCIAGWSKFLTGHQEHSGLAVNTTKTQREAYHRLVCPPSWCVQGMYTPKEAEIALEAYLMTGEADWS